MNDFNARDIEKMFSNLCCSRCRNDFSADSLIVKQKIKNIYKRFIDYTLTNEFKIIVMTLLFGFLIIATLWALLFTAIAEDLTDKIDQVAKENEALTIKNEQLEYDNVRYKMMYEETYELFTSCVETQTWYEKFYYDNVDPYTGEIEGEYYE